MRVVHMTRSAKRPPTVSGGCATVLSPVFCANRQDIIVVVKTARNGVLSVPHPWLRPRTLTLLLCPQRLPVAPAPAVPKPKAKKVTPPAPADEVPTQRELPRDSPTPPARSKPSAVAKRATLGDIPIRVKPTKQQLAASKEEQQTAKYLLGIKNKNTATMTAGASNRFKALEESAHIEEVDQPEPKTRNRKTHHRTTALPQ
jgi:hypothetical protein